jgi:nicotinamidase/pyrazinamidase
MRKALILIDIQNDFMPGGALPVSAAHQIIPVLNKAQQKFDLIVATKDWHPSNHGSFALNHPNAKVGEAVLLDGLPQILWPAHCVQQSAGADFVAKLNTEKLSKIFHKGVDSRIDSYSGFYDNAHRRSTGLGEFLQEQGVQIVFIGGLATDYCVKYSVLDACQLGFQTYVIEDGCAGIELQPGDIKRAFAEMKKAGAVVVHSDGLDEVLKELG